MDRTTSCLIKDREAGCAEVAREEREREEIEPADAWGGTTAKSTPLLETGPFETRSAQRNVRFGACIATDKKPIQEDPIARIFEPQKIHHRIILSLVKSKRTNEPNK